MIIVKLVSYTCPACGAHLNIGEGRGFVICEYCDTSFQIIDDRPVARPVPEERKTNQVKAQPIQRAQTKTVSAPPKTSSYTWLFVVACVFFWPYMLVVLPIYAVYKVLRPTGMKFGTFCLWTYGWIIFFPIPLAILLMRKSKSRA